MCAEDPCVCLLKFCEWVLKISACVLQIGACVLNSCACALAGNIRQYVHVHHRLLDSDFVACVSDFVCAC